MLLKIGSKGEDVKKLQEKLGIGADGIFGVGTQAAVKKWQARNGLIADGVVGPNTWSKLFGKKFDISATEEKKIDASESKPTILPEAKIAPGELKYQKLMGHIPDFVFMQIADTSKKFQINTPLRLAHFLAQCAHESQNFLRTQENLNYSKDGLNRVFPKYFPNNLAESYAKQPEKIASRVYGGRMGNGPENTKEGFKFRGRGYIQLTGKNNYKAFGEAIGVDVVSNPDLVATKYPLLSAAWFFKQNCLTKCDGGANKETVSVVTRCVNGGQHGLEDRMKYFNKYYNLLK